MSKTDLSALRMEGGGAAPVPRRPLAPRVFAVVFALVATALLSSFLLPILRPPRAVRTAAVQAMTASAAKVATAEAAGWIEPEPFAVVARPLVKGVLAELPLLEGAAVTAGETVVGRIESAELLAARDRARADLALREAELSLARTELEVAQSLLEQKADLRSEAARARGEVAALEARIEALAAEVQAAEAAKAARDADLAGQEKLLAAGGSYPVALAKARAAVEEAAATVRAKSGALEEARAQRLREAAIRDIAEEVLGDPRGLRGTAAEARSRADRATAERDVAATELTVAERELAWCVVKAPIDGVVLRLLSAPGSVVGPEGEGIVSLYDPKRLQARVDVPLGSVGGVREGQDVEVKSEVLGSKATRGVVLRVQRESDLLKNTLQVKVRLVDPDPLLRPETLCRARFLAPQETEPAREITIFRVPREALRKDAVFVLDPRDGGRARRVGVERVGDEGNDVAVRGDLSPTHRVILDAVEDGEKVKEERP